MYRLRSVANLNLNCPTAPSFLRSLRDPCELQTGMKSESPVACPISNVPFRAWYSAVSQPHDEGSNTCNKVATGFLFVFIHSSACDNAEKRVTRSSVVGTTEPKERKQKR
mmetsp:Transcript_28229/g.53005  ORF Transcript_28229/g.53005 Transcript_28229/m.53005 type:complete len:110 (+) Transcript_28229:2794-3123(+)